MNLPSRLLVGAFALALLAPAPSLAAGGISQMTPKAGAKIPVAKRPTFKMKVQGEGTVWVHVCKSKKKDAEGVICSDESIGQAKKKGGFFTYKAKYFDFDGFWLNTPGTYYWQAFRISCGEGSDCRQESKIIKFKVG